MTVMTNVEVQHAGRTFNRFHLLQLKHALRFEIAHPGEKIGRGSLVKTAQKCGYSTKTDKQGVLDDILALMDGIAAGTVKHG